MNERGDGRLAGPGAARARFVVMAALATAFLLRAAGQAALVAGWAPWLPPAEEWQSGLLPYPVLLAAQLVILAAMAAVLRDVWRGGRHATPARFGPTVRRFAGIYVGAMLLRYVLTRAAHPEWGPLGHTIPIWLHMALASWLWLWASPATGAAPRSGRGAGPGVVHDPRRAASRPRRRSQRGI